MKRNGNISESGKLLILGIGVLLILAIIVIVLVVRMKDDVRKRDAVVEMLKELDLSPPVPTISRTSLSCSM